MGEDLILVCNEIWLNKPADLADPRAQLQALRGRTHKTEPRAAACSAPRYVSSSASLKCRRVVALRKEGSKSLLSITA